MNWLRKAIAHLALSRSDAALIKASGAEPRSARGRKLDPRFQFIEAQARKSGANWSTMTPEIARKRTDAASSMFGGANAPNVRAEKLYVTGRSHSVPCRLYLPRERDSKAVMLVYFHFGGGVIGSLESCNRLCGLIADQSKAPVLSVDYRLAPEHPFPAGYEDAIAAYLWARENAARYGAAVGEAAIGGDSMGGCFAAALAQDMRTSAPPKLQALIYPLVDFLDQSPSMQDFADYFPLTFDAIEFFSKHYFAREADKSDPRVAPARTQNLNGLARALVYTAGFDILLDQGEAYADKLAAAGVNVTRHCFETLPHGFVAFPSASPVAEAANQRIAHETGAALSGRA